MASVRILFTGPGGKGAGVEFASGELRLNGMGGGRTLAKRDEPRAAEIRFHIAYLEKVRRAPPVVPQPFARLLGELWLEGFDRTPVFQVKPPADSPSALVHEESLDEGHRRRRRSIELRLAAPNFRAPPGDDGPVRLILPQPDNELARYAEIHTELRIADTVEAPLGTNDGLDMVLTPLRDGPMFEWPDALGQELPSELTLVLKRGNKSTTVPWSAGRVSGGFRRFDFSRLEESAPCTLIATAAGRRLVLLENQALDDLEEPIRWKHWLEELAVPTSEPTGDIPFAPVSGPPGRRG